MRPSFFASLLVLVLLAATLAAQAPQTAGSPDTATLRGRVFDGRTGKPLRRVTVRAESGDGGAAFLISTGADGTFAFDGLTSGRYQITAQRGGFGVGGFAIDLRNGEIVERADVTLRPGGAIVGRVVDEFGDPVPDVQVNAVRFYTDHYGYRVQDVTSRGSATNDIGEYRVWGLRPGDYYVLATPPGTSPTYAPGASGIAQAQRIDVALGQTYEADIALLDTKSLTVSGTVLSADGRPFTGRTSVAHGSIRLYEQGTRTFVTTVSSELKPDGVFRVSGVEPGDYLLEIIGTTGVDDDLVQVAHANILVSGSDVENVMMRAVRPSTVSGRITLRDGSRASLNLPNLKIFADYLDHFIQVTPASVAGDLTFAVKVFPGWNSLVLLNYGPPGWQLQAVHINGRDVTRGFEVSPGTDVRDVEVVLTGRPAMITGKVVAADDRPPRAPFVGVIVFAQDPAERRTGLGQWWVRANYDGTFSTKVLAGDYYVVAVDDLNMSQAFDPELLESIAPFAERVSVSDNEQLQVQIRVMSTRH